MPAMGVLHLAIGLAVLGSLDVQVEAALLDVKPDWLMHLTSRFLGADGSAHLDPKTLFHFAVSVLTTSGGNCSGS